jgi:hypothetical protein
MFARKFIADNRSQAHQLNPQARYEFRSIVYSYMSRIRRGDARLYFPDRVVHMHEVDPTPAEHRLIRAIAEPIQNLNRLAQISILQALTSSPEALMAQLNNMARNGTVPQEFAATVRDIVIGDIDALLEAAGIGEEGDNGATSFEKKILQLVLAALEGRDVKRATRLIEQSITDAKNELEREEENINAILGGMGGFEYVGPRAPPLPNVVRSMEPSDFTLTAFKVLEACITPHPTNHYLVEENGRRELIRFTENADAGVRSTLYAPGTPAFLRLVNRVIATGICDIEDLDQNTSKESKDISQRWVFNFGGTPKAVSIQDVTRCFEGTALVRVRATVAHDSYERLVEVFCSSDEHQARVSRSGSDPLPSTIEDPRGLGINLSRLADAAKLDSAISEFSRFYLERRGQEMMAASDDQRKRKKLEDDFTPRLEMTLVALDGRLHRKVSVEAHYGFDTDHDYHSLLTVVPHTGELVGAPELGRCAQSGKTVPKTCLKQCQISGALALQHLLVQSEISSRLALPEFTVLCSLSGKRILNDEAELSAVSGQLVATRFLKTSAISKKRAEPEYIGQCEFTRAEVLNTELATSEVSGKRYRIDEQERSAVTGRTGHKKEFIVCHQTRQYLTVDEAEQCEATGRYVKPGILEPCAITQKRVLPSELLRCAETGKKAIKKLFVKSSLTGADILEESAIRSATGKFCASVEAKPCLWSGRKSHPDDLRVCELTGLPIHIEFVTSNTNPSFQPLVDLLNGIKRTTDAPQLWGTVKTKLEAALGSGRCRVEAAVLSPDKKHLAVYAEVRTLLGLRMRQAGLVYAIEDHSIVGRVVQGRRTSKGWSEVKS